MRNLRGESWQFQIIKKYKSIKHLDERPDSGKWKSLLVYIFSGTKQHKFASISEKIWEMKILASFE